MNKIEIRNIDNKITKAFVKKILENATSYEWSIQGLGMLRLYLSKELRLHVWTEMTTHDVSTIHNHPWDFHSWIIAGYLRNIRYHKKYPLDLNNYLHNQVTIVCGIGGGVEGLPKPVQLEIKKDEVISEGQDYYQFAEEIHETLPRSGTVTLIERTFREDTEHAHVFYPAKSKWGSAEPRIATPEEVQKITSFSLEKWFKS